MIGIDMLEIARMERPMQSKRFRERVFTAGELDYIAGRGVKSAAGLFCAKEALAKAMGVSIFAALKTVEIVHTSDGKPIVLKPEGFVVSITHTKGIAAAVASSTFLLSDI
jgi:holo-[acyl-carrier protein] synthase